MNRKIPTTFRQGDVALVLPLAQIDAIPAGAKEIKPEARGIVLAHGEVTGHAHRIEVPKKEQHKVRYWDAGAERYLQVLERATLRHEEHGEIVLDKGIYRQAFQVEDFGTEVRRVAD